MEFSAHLKNLETIKEETVSLLQKLKHLSAFSCVGSIYDAPEKLEVGIIFVSLLPLTGEQVDDVFQDICNSKSPTFLLTQRAYYSSKLSVWTGPEGSRELTNILDPEEYKRWIRLDYSIPLSDLPVPLQQMRGSVLSQIKKLGEIQSAFLSGAGLVDGDEVCIEEGGLSIISTDTVELPKVARKFLQDWEELNADALFEQHQVYYKTLMDSMPDWCRRNSNKLINE